LDSAGGRKEGDVAWPSWRPASQAPGESAREKDPLSRIIAQLDRYFADDGFPADARRWREAKRRLIRALDGLDGVELERGVRLPEEQVNLRHGVRNEELASMNAMDDCASAQRR